MARRFVIFLWDARDTDTEDAALRHLQQLEDEGHWQRVFVQSGWAIALEQPSALNLRRIMHGRGLVLGDLFPADAGQPAPGDRISLTPASRTSQQVFCGLSRRYWGRYVAIHQAGPLEPVSVFRDPSGALECVSWRLDRLTIVASHLPSERPELLGDFAALRWEIIGDCLGDSAAIGSQVAIKGVEALAAGEMMRLGDGSRRLVWSPSALVSSIRQPREVLHELMRQRVDQVVGAYAGRADTILAEISGGLDSAIVASTLQRLAPGKVAEWLNFHTPDPEGDERAFARAVAAKLGLSLTEQAKSELRIVETGLAFAGAGLRPSVVAVDYEYDQDNAERSVRLGADTLITGQGGDIVFLNTRAGLLAADALHVGVPLREFVEISRNAAAADRVSVWSVVRRALASSLQRPAPRRAPAYLRPALRSHALPPPAHPWLSDLTAMPPVKRLQIHALAAAQLVHGHSRRGQAADLVHPLLSQPLVEFCLSVPSFDLALGSNDRALAREAFADRLPQALLARRSKGETSAYYGRMLARSLDLIRPYLLDGLLAAEGLIDRAYLEGALTAETVLWSEMSLDLIELVAVEAWARHWSAVLATRRRSG